MGLLTEGEPLSWEETAKLADHVRQHGVKQFVRLYKKLENRRGDVLKWGDEVEYNLVKVDKENSRAQLLLNAKPMLDFLHKQEAETRSKGEDPEAAWHPEFAAYMIEGTPGGPYESSITEFNKVQDSMRRRRKEIEAILKDDEMLFSLTAFPRMGCPGFTYPEAKPHPQTSHTKSLFWPSEATFPGHPRFKNLARNIRSRRGQKVSILVPVYRDENTVDPFKAEEDILMGPGQEEVSKDVPKPWHIYMDAMGFGMGLSCLQITFQASNLVEAETLYDQLTPMCPIMLAMTASAPIFRGYLADVDCRWDIIAASVDCRTKEERGEAPVSANPERAKYGQIPKSRYGSVSSYISECVDHYKGYNDKELVHDEKVYQYLLGEGIKAPMAKHVAHLFIRDTVSLFSEKVTPKDEDDTDHFENIQSTNWQTMRFKPPPPHSKIGWRVEFRPCELQVTDFENAAICCFIVLLTRVLISYKYNLLVPISMVDENMKRAQKRDAVLEQKFFFRTNIQGDGSCSKPDDTPLCAEPIIEELTMDQIFNGTKSFPGLLILIQEYLTNLDIDTDTACILKRYMGHLSDRACGNMRTNARYMRDFVTGHPDYLKDSVVSEKIQFDLLMAMDKIARDTEMSAEDIKSSTKLKEHLWNPSRPRTYLSDEDSKKLLR